MTTMPAYIYSPNDAARARAAVDAACRKLTVCERRTHCTKTRSEQRKAQRSLLSAQRQLRVAEELLALAESKRPSYLEAA